MDRRDYYVEYYEVLDRVLSDYVNQLREKREHWLKMGRHDVGVPLINLLFWQFTWHREEYDRLRKEGKSCGEALGSVKEILADKQVEEWERQEEEYKIYDHEWYEALAPYGGQLVIYIYNARQLVYLTPLIERLEEPVLLLSEYEIPDETELPDFVTAITLEFTKTAPLVNPFLKEWFPLIFQYANTFDILMRILQPKGLIFLEGCHYQQLLLATIGRDYGVPTLCIQQGWPSLMHTAFRRMPYRYYLMWGEGFRTLWEKHNPLPDFVPTGYMYQVEPRNETKKECVTFFLQGPFFLSDKRYLQEMIRLIGTVAAEFPARRFLVREHPEFRIGEEVRMEWEQIPNIEMVTDGKLAEVFARTRVGVAHYSSSLMEGVAHGAVPLVYDPTEGSRYSPDVEAEGLGMIAKTKEELTGGLSRILGNYEDFKQRIEKEQPLWFQVTGEETLRNMVGFIKEKMPPVTLKEIYVVDTDTLTRERPVGVSGVLRCKNCEDFLEMCIDSCIDGLDELIAVYHDCTDRTPEILRQKAAQYPDKIRVFEYRPSVYPIDLDEEELEKAKLLPPDSIHTLAGYCNYALSKASYRYAVKIDADQVYFTDRLKHICDAYRSDKKVRFNVAECISYNLYRAYVDSFNRIEMRPFRWLERIALWTHASYASYLEKMIIRYKVPVSMSGINLFRKDREWMVGLGQEHPEPDSKEILPPFNGVRDTFFFEVSADRIFRYMTETKPDGRHRGVEVMRCPNEILDVGFCWFHLRALMKEHEEGYRQSYRKHPERFIPLGTFVKLSYRNLQQRYKPFVAVRWVEPVFAYFFMTGKWRIPWKKLKEIE